MRLIAINGISRTSTEFRAKGFSLIELMVVLAIIGVLLATILPAVQSARVSAQKAQCQNNLHQIGIAVSSFHGRKNRFPSDRWFFSELASDLEMKTFQFGSHPDENDIVGNSNVLRCPSDQFARASLQNYFVNNGSKIEPRNGLATSTEKGFIVWQTLGKPLSFRDFTDGLSNTAILSEHLGFTKDEGSPDKLRVIWTSPERFGKGQESQLLASLDQLWKRVGVLNQTGHLFENTIDCRIYYDHLWVPNRPVVNEALTTDAGDRYRYVMSPNSNHLGGVNVGFADGSVRFIFDNIDHLLWANLGSRNGGEPNLGVD